jgi:hypothetical protein
MERVASVSKNRINTANLSRSLTFPTCPAGTLQVTPLEHLYETIMQSSHFLPPA